MQPGSLQDLFIEELKDIFDAEQQILQALPKMEQAASSAELKTAFRSHATETEGQVRRLERIFQQLGQQPGGKTCKGIRGLIQEGEELIRQGGDPETLDAGLIGAAQKVEHYEIAAYGTLRTWATQLGNQEACRSLQETLDEEGATDKKLTRLAESRINTRAADQQAA